MEKGIVKKVEQGKDWESKYGTINTYYVEIEQDGKILKGNINKKPGNAPKFIVGKEATFTKKDNHNTNMFDFKWDDGSTYNPPFAPSKTTYKKDGNSQYASFALSYAKDAVANRNGSIGYHYGLSDSLIPDREAENKAYIEDIKYTATEFLKWLKENG